MATGRALRATGLSRSTLHRWKHDGLLEEGIHFKQGATPKSPTRWNVSAIEDAIRARRALGTEKPATKNPAIADGCV